VEPGDVRRYGDDAVAGAEFVERGLKMALEFGPGEIGIGTAN